MRTSLPSLHHGDAAIVRVQVRLQKLPAESITIEKMAAKAKLGERTFLQQISKGDRAYTHRVRTAPEGAEKARELLEFTTLSMKEISWKVGYEDTGFFRKTFQKIIGLPPIDYRRRFGTGDRIAN